MMPVLQMPSSPLNRQQRRAKARRDHSSAHPEHAPESAQAPAPRASSVTPVLPGIQLTHEQAVLLDLYGQQPLAFHRVFVDITGSVTSALWLSHAVGLANSRSGDEGIFSQSQDECQHATGLSRREQEGARARLRDIALLSERRLGRVVEYHLDLRRLAQQLLDHSAQTWSLERTVGTTQTSA